MSANGERDTRAGPVGAPLGPAAPRGGASLEAWLVLWWVAGASRVRPAPLALYFVRTARDAPFLNPLFLSSACAAASPSPARRPGRALARAARQSAAMAPSCHGSPHKGPGDPCFRRLLSSTRSLSISTSSHHSAISPPQSIQVKKAIEKGNIDGAKIYAQNAIRKKTEALNYLKLASRLDATVSRLDAQAKMQAVTKSMAGIVKSLDKALASNNLDKVAETMDQFEKQFENLDVQSSVMEGAMNAQASLATPAEDVAALLQQVADEHGLEVQLGLPAAGAAVAAPAAGVPAEKDDLSARLAELRGAAK